MTPYKQRPARPTVCYLTPEGVVLSEHGRELSLDDWPARHRLWTSFDTARLLVSEGRGEALCWNGEELRWRHRRHEDEQKWLARPSDAHVLRLPLEELEPAAVVKGLARWADWLEREGAGAIGTAGSCAWSLLRATLEETLYTPAPSQTRPPLTFTLGGRQELGPAGAGRFEGVVEMVDMQAAYARTLGGLLYGGRWLKLRELGRRTLDSFATDERPVFVKARVVVPEGLRYGPLPDRPVSPDDGFFRFGIGAEYPLGVTLTNVWTWQELAAAEAAGARISRVWDGWVHVAGGRRPFAPWLEAVERGRALPGLAGLLAKVTGNALWGRFCMRTSAGRRTIRARHGRQTVSRPAISEGGAPAAHDLAETVSGRVRARLYAGMLELGDELLAVHTDGGWRLNRSRAAAPASWRVKLHASRLDLLGPQTLRYRPLRGPEVALVAGTPSGYAAQRFAELWARERMPA